MKSAQQLQEGLRQGTTPTQTCRKVQKSEDLVIKGSSSAQLPATTLREIRHHLGHRKPPYRTAQKVLDGIKQLQMTGSGTCQLVAWQRMKKGR